MGFARSEFAPTQQEVSQIMKRLAGRLITPNWLLAVRRI
jgi:hypothetical protein